MNHWMWLTVAIAAELVGTTALKASEGFSRWGATVLTVVGYAVAFYCLAQTLKRMEVGVVYAIWSGAGTAFMALIGYWVFRESLDPVKVASIAMIVIGVVGLNLGPAWGRGA